MRRPSTRSITRRPRPANIPTPIHDALAPVTPDGKRIPKLAQAWPVSEDGPTWTIRLRAASKAVRLAQCATRLGTASSAKGLRSSRAPRRPATASSTSFSVMGVEIANIPRDAE